MSFMLVSIDDDTLAFQVISRTGQTVDSGEIDRPADPGQQTAPSQPDTAAEKPETAAVP
jgi:hypothetical protein